MPEDDESNDIPVFPSSTSSTSSSKSRTFDILAKPRSDSCRVRTLFIDFNAIGWGEFVVAPSGYRANYCDGGCPFPLDMKFNPSNHATVQTLIHLIDKNKTGEALCAPSLMDKPLSFLFIDNNQVKIKKYLDMSVIQCGCQ
uniref:TGF-beta family profile domain-containing protein n=1 Tax=Panagrolaimus davidi TaxID=227884 RepID=A0A914NZ94_9BILA